MTTLLTPDLFNTWLDSTYGQALDVDGSYGPQCVDVPNHLATTVLSLPYSRGNGKDKAKNMSADYASAGAVFVPPTETFKPGDVFSTKPLPGVPEGHTGVILADNLPGGMVRVYDQNWSGTAARAVGGTQIHLMPRDWIAGACRLPQVPELVTVKAGDTLWRLSRAYGVKLTDILALNPDIVPENLQVGDKVRITADTSVTLLRTTVEANVRRGPSMSAEVIEAIPPGIDYYPTGTVTDGWIEGRTPWRVQHNTPPVWISGDLLEVAA